MTWPRRIRGAVGMGVTWAVAWGLVVMLLGMTSILVPGTPLDFLLEIFDDEMLPIVVTPAFLGGLSFSAVLGIAGRNRRFDESSLPGFAALGAMGGVLLGLVPLVATTVGFATANVPLWPLAAVICGSLALMGAASASGSLLLARSSEDRELLDAGQDIDAEGLTEAEAETLLESGG